VAFEGLLNTIHLPPCTTAN